MPEAVRHSDERLNELAGELSVEAEQFFRNSDEAEQIGVMVITFDLNHPTRHAWCTDSPDESCVSAMKAILAKHATPEPRDN